MGNPFDEIVAGKSERNERSEKKQVSEHSRDHVEVKFVINKRFVERLIFLIIIIALAIMVAINPFQQTCQCGSATVKDSAGTTKVETAPVAPAPNTTAAAQPVAAPKVENKTTAPAAAPAANATKPVATTPSAATAVSFKDGFVFAISSVEMTRDSNNNPMLMKSITIAMKNNWKNFRPTVRVYWYDGRSTEAMEAKLRTTWNGNIFSKGTEKTQIIDKFDFKLIEQGETKEIVKLELYDSSTNELLDTYTKTVS